ncbi:class I SAM-dependent methyltransferase [Roseovarius sp. THAF8]|uniref:class I SAM-dependent methyltransferase n=1 Tax=Roseovarius sp. THAF8 TaxID=2587846 RepID=UPI0012679A6D|nr:class I SAM-dependent methyltransferase [Roseovarius sp. THAF8]
MPMVEHVDTQRTDFSLDRPGQGVSNRQTGNSVYRRDGRMLPQVTEREIEPMPSDKPIQIVKDRANERSADFIEANIANALLFGRKSHLLDYVATLIKDEGLMIECGVFTGGSINHMAGLHPDRTLFGFDSFEGLSENWTGNHHKSGHFDLGGQLPNVEPNVELVKGWIDDTFQPFLKKNPGDIAYLHVDTDTYQPAKTILQLAKPRLRVGSVILFDELFGYPAWEHHEYKALTETIPEDKYEFVAFSQMQAALRITKALK